MRITERQQEFLDGLTCQRLSDDPDNQNLIKKFTCRRNPKLAAYLKYMGWEEDTSGAITFYVIKDRKGRILYFFSLKCGALFDPLDILQLRARVDECQYILSLIRKYRLRKATEEEMAQIEKKMLEYDMSISELQWALRDEINLKNQKISEAKIDKNEEVNPKVAQAIKTYPAVELVHFCGNDGNKEYWRKVQGDYGFYPGHSMGQVLFWYHIAPILTGINRVLGCQYVYLFAADSTLNRKLVNYYATALNFSQDTCLGTNKPRYDFTCEFMHQKIEDLRSFREYYFENFNPDGRDIII